MNSILTRLVDFAWKKEKPRKPECKYSEHVYDEDSYTTGLGFRYDKCIKCGYIRKLFWT